MTQQEIKRLAMLSKLEFDDKELSTFESEFKAIVDFVSKIEKANVNEDIFISQVDFKDLRADEVRPSLSQEQVLKNAPDTDGEYIIVPQVVE